MSPFTIELSPNGGFRLFVPNPAGGHHLNIPMTLQGMKVMRKVLADNAKREDKRISTNETQWMVDKWLAQDRFEREVERERKEAAKAVVSDLENATLEGLDLSL